MKPKEIFQRLRLKATKTMSTYATTKSRKQKSLSASDFKEILVENASDFIPKIKDPHPPASKRNFSFEKLEEHNVDNIENPGKLSLAIVETRQSETDALALTLMAMKNKINAQIILICGEENANSAKKAMQQSGFKNYTVLRVIETINSADDYNRLLMSFDFWEQIPNSEKLLIFQSDSSICEKSNFSIKDFENFDYIGGQWNISRPCGLIINGGSGGFSLRDRKLSIQALKLFGNSSWQFGEDGFYGFFIDVLGGKVGSQNDMDNFCSEKTWKKGCFAIHKLRIDPNDMNKISSIREHCPTWLQIKGLS